jgi:hypothetical protein
MPMTAAHSTVARSEFEVAEFLRGAVVFEGAGLLPAVDDGEVVLLPVRSGAPGDTVFVVL